MKKTLIFIITLNFVFACNIVEIKDKNEKRKKNSTVIKECETIKEFSNENYEVSYCKSYIDSNLIREGFYANGKPMKEHSFYNNGIKTDIIEYIMISEDSSIINNYYKLTNKGDTILDESNFYELTFSQDSFTKTDSIEFEIVLKAPLYQNSISEVVIKNYDNESFWVVQLLDNKANIKIPFTTIGGGTISGTIREMKVNKDSSGISRDLIVDRKYKVKD